MQTTNSEIELQTVWTLDEAKVLFKAIENLVNKSGYHAALAGSVFYDQYSFNDLDFIIYPHSGTEQYPQELINDLAGIFTEFNNCGKLEKDKQYYSPGKSVYRGLYKDKLINFIVLTLKD